MSSLICGLMTLCLGGCQIADEHKIVICVGADVAQVSLLPAAGQSHCVVALAADDRELELKKLAAQELPPVWIGVRLTSVPEALAAHIGDDGLMIGNVVKDSPADAAGLERYDVITAFNGRAIQEMKDLVGAIGDAGAGNQVKMVVIRGGKERTLRITPADRPESLDIEWNYAEPDEADDMVRYFGHRLRRGPKGLWFFTPLGRLKGLPGPLQPFKDLKDLDWLEGLKDLKHGPFRFRIEIDSEEEGGPHSRFDDDAKVEIKLKIVKDGQTLEIERLEDGKIAVRRVDEDGNESSAVYDDFEQLEEEDPEAAKYYGRVCGDRVGAWIVRPPHLDHLPDLQKHFQIQIEKRIERIREDAQRAGEEAHKAAEHARELIEKQMRRFKDEVGEARTESLMIMIEDDGRITVVETKDGETTRHEFEDEDELKAHDPELYRRIKRYRKSGGDARSRGDDPPTPARVA